MAIVKLSKLSVIGLNETKADVLGSLMKLGVVEINSQENKLADEQWSSLVQKDGDEDAVYSTDVKIAEASSALDTLEKYYKGKKPLIKTRKAVSENEFVSFEENKSKAEALVKETNEAFRKISALRSEENRLNTSIISLKPWAGYDVDLDMKETKSTSIFIGSMPVAVSWETAVSAVDGITDKAVLYKVSEDEKDRFISAVCINEEAEDVLDALRKIGFSPIVFEDIAGKAAENIASFEKELAQVKEDISSREKELSSLAKDKETVEYYYDSLTIKRDKASILSNIVKTKRSFYFDGWCPEASVKDVENILNEKGCYYEFTEPEKDEETPVLLKQSKLAEPFEAITDLYSLPNSKEIDPTPFLAPFYFIFFGLMLSDAGYGLILSVACFILLKKFRLEGLMKKLITLFMYCGISTMFWGIMFGGVFGDFAAVFGRVALGKEIAINPVWFDPVKEPMTLLVFSLILGAIHLFVGMGIKAYMLIKSGHVVDAVCDIFLWYVLLIGLVLFGVGGSLAPAAAVIGKWMSIIGALGILVTGGRSKKGIGKVTGGLGSLYGITSYLSDVLSYSRLLALGLATGVVAQVINTLGSLAGNGIVGTIILIIVVVIGTVFNIAINVLGSFVHSSRLQYVEFFGKFFEGGGVAFNPFSRKTKYVDIVGDSGVKEK